MLHRQTWTSMAPLGASPLEQLHKLWLWGKAKLFSLLSHSPSPSVRFQTAGKEREQGEYRQYLVNNMQQHSIVLHYGSHSNPIKSAVSVLLLIDGWGRRAQTDSFTQHLLLVNNNWCYHNKNKFSNSSLYVQPRHKGVVGCSEFNRVSSTKSCMDFFFFFTIKDVYLQYEDNVDVWLHDGTLFLLQQMALIHIN